MKKVHLIAACGVGMASLAGMLKEKGYRVTGSDADIYPPMSTQLESLGIRIRSPYAAENIPEDADLVIVGNAVSRENPESMEAVRRGLATLSMPQAVEEIFLPGKETVVVAGTHGKTTTTSLAGWSLFSLGADPSFLVGGIPLNFPVSYRLGNGRHFVIEGDEYDTAYFDKGPKFLHYRPRIAILTSIEFDHADIYRDLPHLVDAFRRLVRILPDDGMLVACANYPDVIEVAKEAPCPVVYYRTVDGPSPELPSEPWSVRVIDGEGEHTRFRMERDRVSHAFPLRLPGRHNAANGAAVAVVLLDLGYAPGEIARAFHGFLGVARRQEAVGEFGGVLLIDDFAHHPTAVRETIAAVRLRYPGRPVTAVFEPRSNTSRRNLFQKEFAEALSGADSVVVAPVFGAEKFPAAERLDPEAVAEVVRANGRKALYIGGIDRIVEHLAGAARPGEMILLLSNGGFGGIRGKLAAALGGGAPRPHEKF